MARDNQTLQIGLIVSIICAILFLVTTILFFRSSQEQYRRAESASTSATKANQDRDTALFKNQAYEFMLAGGGTTEAELEEGLANIPSVAEDETLQSIRDQFQEDMALFGDQFAENRNYQKLPDYLRTTLRDLNQQLAAREAEVKKLTTEKQQLQTDATARIQEAQQGLQQATTDLQNERKQFAEARQKMQAALEQVTAQLEQNRQQYQQLLADSATKETELNQRVQNLQNMLAFMRTKVDELGGATTFEQADGRITRVNQRSRTVWIDLGSADNLRRQMTFSVYDQDASGVMKKEPKGSIEVTEIRGPHLAEATIVEQENRDIMMPGDRIHTPAWRPGRQIRFALAGFFDINNDGRSDRELLKSLIRLNNGIIDAEVNEQGQIEGELTPLTRYLVLGAAATENQAAADIAARTAMVQKAQEYGVQQLPLDELLNFIGWRGEAGTVSLRGPAAAAVRPGQQAAPPQSTGGATPPARGRNGAF